MDVGCSSYVGVDDYDDVDTDAGVVVYSVVVRYDGNAVGVSDGVGMSCNIGASIIVRGSVCVHVSGWACGVGVWCRLCMFDVVIVTVSIVLLSSSYPGML